VRVDLAAGTAVGAETGHDRATGFETVVGGAGDDTLSGSAVAERLFGAAGDDRVLGHGGADTLIGGAGEDSLSGGNGADRLVAGAGHDRLLGGAGDDLLRDGGGADVVDAGSGDDELTAALDAADDRYAGGAGTDTLDYSEATQALVIDLSTGTATGLEIGEDAITGFERVLAGGGDDRLVAGAGSLALAGGAGWNLFEFRPEQGAVGLAEALHEILDFKQGDRIRLSKYDLFEQPPDGSEDRFEAIYGAADEERAWIRYRHDDIDDRTSLTRVEADFDRDATFETTILISGHHVLALAENT
jgi:Ca2+-binding RTX toxin-like protein